MDMKERAEAAEAEVRARTDCWMMEQEKRKAAESALAAMAGRVEAARKKLDEYEHLDLMARSGDARVAIAQARDILAAPSGGTRG